MVSRRRVNYTVVVELIDRFWFEGRRQVVDNVVCVCNGEVIDVVR